MKKFSEDDCAELLEEANPLAVKIPLLKQVSAKFVETFIISFAVVVRVFCAIDPVCEEHPIVTEIMSLAICDVIMTLLYQREGQF